MKQLSLRWKKIKITKRGRALTLNRVFNGTGFPFDPVSGRGTYRMELLTTDDLIDKIGDIGQQLWAHSWMCKEPGGMPVSRI